MPVPRTTSTLYPATPRIGESGLVVEDRADPVEPLGDLPLVPAVAGLVVPRALQLVGQVLLRGHRMRLVVGVDVRRAVAEHLGARVVRVPQMGRDRADAART